MPKKTSMPVITEWKPPSVDELVSQATDSAAEPDRYRQADRRVASQDAAGFESEMMDFGDYNDGYGNNVASGDMSVQRLVEGGYTRGNEPGYSRPYSTKPYGKR